MKISEANIEKNVKRIVCVKCGIAFDGNPHAKYCPDCKKIRNEEYCKKMLSAVKSRRDEYTCTICGKTFYNYQHTQTCSKACAVELIKQRKLSNKLDTKRWHVVSPEGDHYEFYSLADWARENCTQFGINPRAVSCGFTRLRRSLLGIGRHYEDYKGWKLILRPTPKEVVQMYKNGYTLKKIHNLSNLSDAKIRKILITEGLWKNELVEKIKECREKGHTDEKIMHDLNISYNTLNNYTPYKRGIYCHKKTPPA